MASLEGPIVIAFDGSEVARAAIAAAATLLTNRRALVVTVWESGLGLAAMTTPPEVSMAPFADPGLGLELDHDLQQHAERVAAEGAQLARSLGLEAEPQATPDAGNIPQTILEVARQERASVLVIGSRGLSGLRARLEGSTSKGVVKDADCPVLVVHGPDGD